MTAPVTIVGLPQLQAKLRALPLLAQGAAEQGREQGSRRVAEQAEETVAKLTGETAATISTDGDTVEAGSAAPFLEFGTVHMEAQPFLGPAFEQEQDQVVDDVAQIVRAALARL